jgi:hypothetical protein
MSTASSTGPVWRTRAPSGPSIGNWRLGQRLAESRWTVTYEASCRVGGEPLVIKTIRPDVADGDRLVARGLLCREAEVGLGVSHRHVLATLEVVEEEQPWLVQPLFPKARSAAAITAWPPAARLWVVRQIAEGLATLHHAGWLHSNVSSSCNQRRMAAGRCDVDRSWLVAAARLRGMRPGSDQLRGVIGLRCAGNVR